jgi:PAS domain S-box-containing protein
MRPDPSQQSPDRRWSLHAMLMGLVALTLLPMLALSVFNNFHERALEREAAVDEATRAAGLVAQALIHQTDAARLLLGSLAANPRLDACPAANCSAVLAEYSRLAPGYSNLLLARPDGAVVATAKGAGKGVEQTDSLSGDQALAGALAGQSFAVGVHEGGGEHAEPLASYAAPVRGQNGAVRFVLVAQRPVADASRIYRQARLPRGTTLVLATQNGRILFRLPDAPQAIGAHLPAAQARLLTQGPAETSGWGVGIDGVERFYVMQRLDICPDETCYVRVGIPREAVFAKSAERLNRNLLLLAFTTVLALAAARLWSRRNLLDPAERLMETVRNLGQGDFAARTGLEKGAGELAELARTLDQMAADLERGQAAKEQAQRALFESEESLRAIFNASADGMLLLVPDGRVLSLNEAAARRRGRKAKELTGANILDLVPDYVRNGRRERYAEVAQTGEPLRFEEEREGRTYAIRLHPVRDAGGHVVQIASFSRDITERKLAEKALLAAKDAAEAASRAKTAFLTNMSHELRTPLNGLLGMLQLMAETDDPATLREYLGWASQSARQVTELVNDILDYAALDADKVAYEHRRFSLGEVVSALEADIRSRAQAKALDFSVDIDPDLLALPLMGDPPHLTQALRHLLDNALKFTSSGGVRLTAEVTCAEERDCTLRISVEDTGIGIASEDMGRVFEPFVQAEAPLTKTYRGTGLGLTLARALAEAMGGRLEARSTPGRGSAFSLILSFGTAPAQ